MPRCADCSLSVASAQRAARAQLEPGLRERGYNTKVLAELLNAKPREIKAFLRGQLTPGRTQEFTLSKVRPLTHRKLALMLESLFKRTNDLIALILRMLLSAVSIQHGPQQVLGRFGRLSVVLRWEDSRAKSQAVQSSRRWSQIVRSNFGKSLPDNDYPALAPPFVGIWILPWFLSCFAAHRELQRSRETPPNLSHQ